MILKILTWNCGGGFRYKLNELSQIDCDIYIIQECELTEISKKIYLDWRPNFKWKGNNKNKGIGVFAKNDIDLKALDWVDEGLELFLAIEFNQIQLVAVWTKHANSPTFQYIGQLWKYLNLHRDKVKDKPTILCGDFNSNSRWDGWDRWWNHSDVVNDLNKLEIKSMYHEIFGEKHGEESQSTFFMHRKLEKKYHIDYLFASGCLFKKEFSRVWVLGSDVWLKLSDHVPIIFELNTNRIDEL